MKQQFNNDIATNHVPIGGTVPHAEEHPDDVIQRNLKDTALDHRPLVPDRQNPVPEWSNSYLQRAFIYIFLTGDGALDQLRPVSLMLPEKKYRENYIHMLAMQKGVQEHPEFIFTLYNLLKRNDADNACACLLKEVDVTTIRIPDKEELNDAIKTNNTAHLLMQKNPQIRDTPASCKFTQHEAVGFKRDLEYTDEVTRPNETPNYASLFRTLSPPYMNVYYLHRLFTTIHNDLNDPAKRKRQALLNPGVVEWVISFLSELDVLYFKYIRYNCDWHLARCEYGANGNPHWHSILYSKDLGALCWGLKGELENYFDTLQQERLSQSLLQYADDEIKTMQEKIKERFLACQQKLIDFFRGSYVNWNPSLTHDGKLTDESYGTPNISDISLSTLIDESLMTTDFGKIDKLLCDIIMTTCRHITHTGKNGLPSKRDYCYQEKKKKVKEECTKEKDVFLIKPVCKRRKPQPLRSKAAIAKDKHDRRFYQLTYESNDGLFNGADHFLILLVLGNADTKAMIPSMFVKSPKILVSDDRLSMKLQFFHLDTENAQEYILKYATKSSIPIKPDNDIMKEVLQRKSHEVVDVNNTVDTNNPNTTFNPGMVNSMYKQSAIQVSVCSFNATHVIWKIPLTVKNYHVDSYNCIGRKTIKKNTNPNEVQNPDDEPLYNATPIQLFDNRKNITDLSKKKLSAEDKSLIKGPLSMRMFLIDLRLL